MLDVILQYKFKIAYWASLLAALYVIAYWLPESLTGTDNFLPSMGIFLVAIAFVVVAIYFRTKDAANKNQ